jgi:hypothetical protein
MQWPCERGGVNDLLRELRHRRLLRGWSGRSRRSTSSDDQKRKKLFSHEVIADLVVEAKKEIHERFVEAVAIIENHGGLIPEPESFAYVQPQHERTA